MGLINEIAKDILTAYENKNGILNGNYNLKYEDAYAIQNEVSKHLGPRIGWKIGKDGNQNFVRAPMYKRTFFENNAEVSRKLFHFCLVESELALVTKTDLSAIGASYDLTQILIGVRSIHAGIEICDSRLLNWPNCDLIWQLADSLTHGGYVLGDGVRMEDFKNGLDCLKKATFKMTIGESEQSTNVVVQNTREHPFNEIEDIVVWLVNEVVSGGDTIKAGEIITTGSFSGSSPVIAGDFVSVEFEDFGGAQVHFI